nr:transposase [Novosphingobium sp. IK01]
MMDREWELVARFVPPAKHGGRRRTTDMREVINAILYIAASGGAWRRSCPTGWCSWGVPRSIRHQSEPVMCRSQPRA